MKKISMFYHSWKPKPYPERKTNNQYLLLGRLEDEASYFFSYYILLLNSVSFYECMMNILF